MSDFGSRLKKIRQSRKMTQKTLASLLEVTQSTVANYESNTRFPGESTLRQLADLLDTSTDYLLGIEDKTFSPRTEMNLLPEQILDLLLAGDEFTAVDLVKNMVQNTSDPTKIIEEVFSPMMQEVGRLWENGKIDISQEHYISEITGRLLDLVIQDKPQKPESSSVMLMVPNMEEHTLILKMLKTYFVEAGWRVYLIGKSIPTFSIKYIVDKEEIDWIVLSTTLSTNLNSLEHLIKAIKSLNFDYTPKVILGGHAVKSKEHAINVLGADGYIKDFNELKNQLFFK